MKPRRSILSVPGHVAKMHRKASESQADVIMFDLEDSVPPEAKETARNQTIQSLRSLAWDRKSLSVRINAIDTSMAYRDLLTIGESVGDRLETVVIPKVDDAGDVHFVDRMLNGIESHHERSNRVGVEAIIESAAGLANISAIAAASSRLQTLVFGVADYSASIGARLASLSGHGESEDEIYPGHRWHFALSRIVMTAKAHALQAIDAPYGNFKDPHGLERSALSALALGCDGKWAIHPGQVDVINRVFSPSAADIDRARRILQANEAAVKEGRGAVSLDGRMIDQATVRLAQRLWAQAVHLGLAPER